MGEGIKGIGARITAPFKRTGAKEKAQSKEGQSSVPITTETEDGEASKSIIGRALSSISTSPGRLFAKLSPNTRTEFQKDLERVQKEEWSNYIQIDDVFTAITGREDSLEEIKTLSRAIEREAASDYSNKGDLFRELATSVASIKEEVDSLDVVSLEQLPALQKDSNSLKLLAAGKSLVEKLEKGSPLKEFERNHFSDFNQGYNSYTIPGFDQRYVANIKKDLDTIADAHSKLGPKSFIKPGQTPILDKLTTELQLKAHGRIRQELYKELISEANS